MYEVHLSSPSPTMIAVSRVIVLFESYGLGLCKVHVPPPESGLYMTSMYVVLLYMCVSALFDA